MTIVKNPQGNVSKDVYHSLGSEDSISLESVPFYNTCTNHLPAVYNLRASIDTEKIVLYRDYLIRNERTTKQLSAEKNLSRGKYNGYLSEKTASKIRKKLSGWIESCEAYRTQSKGKYEKNKAYITTPTLTLPAEQRHSDKEIKREILNAFIINLKRKYGVEQYFWIAEAQKNGNVHFHMIIDKYVEKKELQTLWNNCTEVLGYLSQFESKYQHRNPPSTFIIKFRGRKRPINYLVKYVTKKSTARPIEGRLWGSSKGLKDTSVYSEIYDGVLQDEIDTAVIAGKVKVKRHDYATVFFCNTAEIFGNTKSTVGKRMNEFYLDQFNVLYNQKTTERRSKPDMTQQLAIEVEYKSVKISKMRETLRKKHPKNEKRRMLKGIATQLHQVDHQYRTAAQITIWGLTAENQRRVSDRMNNLRYRYRRLTELQGYVKRWY